MEADDINFAKDKPIVLFTSFWDADYLVKQEYFPIKTNEETKLVWLDNYSIHSIALMTPEKLKNINSLEIPVPRIDFLCPTYKILMAEKANKDWEKYTTEYKALLSSRKDEVINWIDNLEAGHLYILCCWEATGVSAHCHREILYENLTKSKSLRDKAYYIYRHGRKGLDASADDIVIEPDILKVDNGSGDTDKMINKMLNNINEAPF